MHRANGGAGRPRGRDFIAVIDELAHRCGVDLPKSSFECARPLSHVEQVWNDAGSVESDAVVCQWLGEERKLDPQLIAEQDLARVLSSETQLPRWAGFKCSDGKWRSWPSIGYRIAIPLYNAYGRVSSMRFRKPEVGAKGRPACGVSSAGTVMADGPARLTLATGCVPDFWISGTFTILIAEGEPDFWSWATEPARAGLGESATSFPIIMGIISGSFDSSVAQRLPQGTRVISAMDDDRGGDHLHDRIKNVLREANRSFTLRRWSAP